MKWMILFTVFFSLQSFAQNKTEALRIMNPKATLYEVLGVAPSATEAEIKTAYRRLMSAYHPDRHQNNSANLKAANQVMSKLNVARETLLDPLKRKSYDMTVKATSAMKPTAEKASGGWQKWNPTDFAKETQEEKAKAQAETKTQAKSGVEPEKPKSSADAPKNTTAKDSTTKPTAPEPSTTSEVARTNRPATSLKGKMAQKAYAEVSRCGVSYFQTFVDVMQ